MGNSPSNNNRPGGSPPAWGGQMGQGQGQGFKPNFDPGQFSGGAMGRGQMSAPQPPQPAVSPSPMTFPGQANGGVFPGQANGGVFPGGGGRPDFTGGGRPDFAGGGRPDFAGPPQGMPQQAQPMPRPQMPPQMPPQAAPQAQGGGFPGPMAFPGQGQFPGQAAPQGNMQGRPDEFPGQGDGTPDWVRNLFGRGR